MFEEDNFLKHMFREAVLHPVPASFYSSWREEGSRELFVAPLEESIIFGLNDAFISVEKGTLRLNRIIRSTLLDAGDEGKRLAERNFEGFRFETVVDHENRHLRKYDEFMPGMGYFTLTVVRSSDGELSIAGLCPITGCNSRELVEVATAPLIMSIGDKVDALTHAGLVGDDGLVEKVMARVAESSDRKRLEDFVGKFRAGALDGQDVRVSAGVIYTEAGIKAGDEGGLGKVVDLVRRSLPKDWEVQVMTDSNAFKGLETIRRGQAS